MAAAGILISAYTAFSASQAQKRTTDLQQSAIQADQAFRQQQLDDYKRTYGPLEAELVKQASSEQPLNLGPNWARIQANFDQAGRNNEASLARKGMLGSGLDAHNMLESGRAFALSDAFSKGLQGRDALRREAISLGRQMPQQVGFVSQGNQNMANLWGDQANQYANAAAGAGQSLAASLGALGYEWGNRQAPATAYPMVTSFPTESLTPITARDTSAWPTSLTPATVPLFGSSPITGPADK